MQGGSQGAHAVGRGGQGLGIDRVAAEVEAARRAVGHDLQAADAALLPEQPPDLPPPGTRLPGQNDARARPGMLLEVRRVGHAGIDDDERVDGGPRGERARGDHERE